MLILRNLCSVDGHLTLVGFQFADENTCFMRMGIQYNILLFEYGSDFLK
jgi:hypothetical protein